MHIHIKPFKFILSNKTQNQNKEEVVTIKEQPKKKKSVVHSKIFG